MTTSRLWNSNFILLTLSGFLLSFAFYLLIPTLPVFLVEVLGADKSRVGWIIAIYTLAALLIRPFSGYAVDRYGRQVILLVSLFLFAVLLGMHLWVATLVQLLLIRFLHGLAWGITTTANSTLIIDIVPESRRGEGIGIYGLAMPLAMAVGPLAGLWLMGDSDFERLFLVGAIVALGAYVLAQVIRFPVFTGHQPGGITVARLFARQAIPVSIAMMIMMMSYGGVISFITLYTLELGLGSAGLFFTVYAIGLSVSRLVAGKVFDRSGPSLIAPMGLLMVSTGLSFLWLFHGAVGFVASGFLIGLGFGILFPVFQAMVNNLVEPWRRGAANSTLFTALDLGIGIGAVITGYLAQVVGLVDAFGLLAIVTSAGLLWYWFVAQPHYNRHYRHGQKSDSFLEKVRQESDAAPGGANISSQSN